MRLTNGGFLLSLSILTGCGTADLRFEPICDGRVDPVTGQPDPWCATDRDAGTDAGEVDGGEVTAPNPDCPEERVCVPPPPHGWSPIPYLMWMGPKGQAPAQCPERATKSAFHGYSNLVAPTAACASCTCETSTGSCEIPAGFTAYSAPGCSPSAVATSFDAPDGWGGTCNAEATIAADAMCGQPPALCVQSVSIGPLLIKEEACAVGAVPAPPPIAFEREALACGLAPQGGCIDGSDACLAAPDPFPGGFRYCIYLEQDKVSPPCPAGYPAGPWVFYEDKYFVDSRECLCACGSPAGSECTAFVSIYEDDTCSAPVFADHMITSTVPDPWCIPVAPGVALESKEITNASYKGGTCEAKGELVGEFDPGPPNTFCCAPELAIP